MVGAKYRYSYIVTHLVISHVRAFSVVCTCEYQELSKCHKYKIKHCNIMTVQVDESFINEGLLNNPMHFIVCI